MARWEVTGAPATEPVTTAEAKEHCFIESGNTTWDTYIGNLIIAAREYTERYLGRALITQTIKEYWDAFPCINDPNPYGAIKLSRNPVISITSVQYVDEDGSEQSLVDGTTYTKDLVNDPAQIVPYYDTDWPDTLDQINSVYVIYVAGYGAASAVPYPIKQAILLAIKLWFDQRDEDQGRLKSRSLPTQVERLLDAYKQTVL